jgi:hypothetical protein
VERKISRGLVLLLAVAVGLGVMPASANASPIKDPRGTSEATAIRIDPARLAEARVAAEKLSHVTRVGDHYDERSAKAAGMNAKELDAANRGLSAGQQARSSCVGGNYSWKYSSWWQGTVYAVAVDSCTAQGVIGAVASFAAVYTIVGIIAAATGAGIPVALVFGLAAGILALGVGVLTICARNGTGSIYRFAPRLGSIWCTNQ